MRLITSEYGTREGSAAIKKTYFLIEMYMLMSFVCLKLSGAFLNGHKSKVLLTRYKNHETMDVVECQEFLVVKQRIVERTCSFYRGSGGSRAITTARGVRRELRINGA